MELDGGGIVCSWGEFDVLGRVTVAWFRKEFLGRGDRFVDVGNVMDIGCFGEESGSIFVIEGYDEMVVFVIFAYNDVVNVVGVGRDADAFALTEGKFMEAGVLPEDFAFNVNDIAGAVGDKFFEEFVNRDFAEEADALGVFFVSSGEVVSLSDFTNFGLFEFADGEKGVFKLILCDEGEKIGLVFIFV